MPVLGSKLQTSPEPEQHSLVQKHIAFSGWQLPPELPPELDVDAPTVDVALALGPVVPPATAVAVVAAVAVAWPVEPVAPSDEDDEAPEDVEEDVSPAVLLLVEVDAVSIVFELLVVPPLPPPQAMQVLATAAIVANLIGRPSRHFPVTGTSG